MSALFTGESVAERRRSDRRQPVELELSRQGIPRAITWLGRRYVVTDRPTRITSSDVIVPEWITHPFVAEWPGEGWRFQGRRDDGDTYMLDVRPLVDGGWAVVGVYA